MKWSNFHSHTLYCDGKMSPEEYVEEALNQNVAVYGFSSHCPVPFENQWSIRYNDFPNYLREIEQLKIKYKGTIELYKSLEIDFIPNIISIHSDIIKNAKLDYTVGSVHFVNQFENEEWWEIDGTTSRFKEGLKDIYQNDIKQAVKDYFHMQRMMVKDACPDIIGHLDKIKMHNSKGPFFNESESWYREEALKTLEEIKASKAIIEVNTRGQYKKYTDGPYPGYDLLKEACKMGIPVCINSDCHHPSEITKCFNETANHLMGIGFKTLRILQSSKWVDVEFDKDGLHL